MQLEQISIFIENKSGRLAEVTRVLGSQGINIRALSLADTSDFGILRLIVDQTDLAKAALKECGFTVSKTEVVAVEVPDQPGGLYGILKVLEDASVNVEYMYAFVQQSGNNAIMIFRFDRTDSAISVLQNNGIPVIDGRTISAL